MTTQKRGPLWTQARLRRVLILRFGASPRGHVNLPAVADAMNVTPRTVQRWLAASSGRAVAHIPPRRLQQLLELLVPRAETIRDEAAAATYARKAIDQLRRGRKRGVLPSWEKRRWLDTHVVAVLAIKEARVRQLTITRSSGAASTELGRRGRIVDFVVVPTRFHADALVHEVLTEIGPWRFQPKPGTLKQGPTRAWLDDAPPVDLAATVTRTGLR